MGAIVNCQLPSGLHQVQKESGGEQVNQPLP
jgi:hypothetical protein